MIICLKETYVSNLYSSENLTLYITHNIRDLLYDSNSVFIQYG